MRYSRSARSAAVATAALLALGGGIPPLAAGDAPAGFQAPKLEPAAEARVLALDCARPLSAADVRTLEAAPAPRVMLIHGGVFPVHLVMESFARFLVGMGYPEAKIREPATGDLSYSPYMDSRQLAGLVALHYERDGMRPMLIGHSQGGLYVVKILKDLAGQNGETMRVFNPSTWEYENRTTIVDPLTGETRPVVGLSVAYGSALGAGGWALLLPNQWERLETLRKIPDTVDEFTGFFVEGDMIALSFRGNPLDSRYEANGKAQVRNVELPATYSHIMLPAAADLAADATVRSWIESYIPDTGADVAVLPQFAQRNALYAADIWFSIKKHWCAEAQHLIRATNASASAAAAEPPADAAAARPAEPPPAPRAGGPPPAERAAEPPIAAPDPKPAS